MKKNFTFGAIGTICLSVALADTIKLNDGKVLENCKIVEESAESVTVLVPVMGSIREEQVIEKSKILKIEKPAEDLLAWPAIGRIVPTADGLTEDNYNDLINKKILPFLAKYPRTSKREDAKKIQGILEEEKAKVASGFIKTNGEWFSSQQIERESFVIEARKIVAQMKRDNASGNYIGALRFFDQFEKTYQYSGLYSEALKIAKGSIAQLAPLMAEALPAAEKALEKRKKALAAYDVDLRRSESAAIAENEANYIALIKREEAAGIRWPSLDPFHPEEIRKIINLLKQEQARLAKVEIETFTDSGALIRKTWEELDKRDLKSAEESLRELQGKCPEKISKLLDDKVSALEKQLNDEVAQAQQAEQKALEEKRKKETEEKAREAEEARQRALNTKKV